MKALNWKNVKPMMKQFHDDGDQDDMKALFEKMIKYEFFNE